MPGFDMMGTLVVKRLKIQELAYQWNKLNKCKGTTNKIVHPPVYSYNATVKLTHSQKHLGLQLGSKLSFSILSFNILRIKLVRQQKV